MKPTEHHVTTTGSLPGTSAKFQLDERGMAHIIRLLTSLYSDIELAVIRELSTNAWDSHIQAGHRDPIEVTTPSALSMFLVIRDHGVGMSVDDLLGLFSSYGASTKRDSDEVTGMLGIGSKSPLAYTNTFTLISRHHGVEATAAVSKDADGVGRIHIIETRATDERNGVEIRIPAQPRNDFDRKATQLFRFWDEGSVMLNGSMPARFEGLELNSDMWLVKAGRHDEAESKIIQGNVPYPAGPGLSQNALGLPYGYGVVAKVPIGSVQPVPSREALELGDPKTQGTVKRLQDDFKRDFKASIGREIDKADSMFEAVRIHNEWRGVLGRNSGMVFTYRGQAMPGKFTAPQHKTKDKYGYERVTYASEATIVNRHRPGRGGHQKYPIVEPTQCLMSIMVTGYEPKSFTPTHRAKLMQWFDKQPLDDTTKASVNSFVLLGFPVDLSWLPAERQVDWAVIAAEKLPKQTGTVSGRIPGSYNLYVGEGLAKPAYTGSSYNKRDLDGIPGDQIDQNYPVYWLHGNQQDAAARSSVLDAVKGDKYTIVCLQANRIDKFKRDSPHIPSLIDSLKSLAQEAANKMTADERMALSMHDAGDASDFQMLAQYKATIKDPAIRKACDLYGIDVASLQKVYQRFSRVVDFPLPTWDNPLDGYPLADYSAARHYPLETIRYINAEHRHQTQEA